MLKIWTGFVCLGISFGIACGRNFGNMKIIGGVDTDISEVPYQVALETKGDQYCGGVIIAKNWILTAAHCVDDYDVNDTSIRTGSSLRIEGGHVIRAKNFNIHPKYDGAAFDHDYDVGLIELISPIDLDENSQIIALPDKEVTGGEIVKISGWGVTSNHGDESQQLQSVEVPIISRDDCKNYFDLSITDRMICGLLTGHNACNGDSGGPVVFNNTVVGVVSWSSYGECAEENRPGVYSNIADSEIRSFIRNVTGL